MSATIPTPAGSAESICSKEPVRAELLNAGRLQTKIPTGKGWYRVQEDRKRCSAGMG